MTMDVKCPEVVAQLAPGQSAYDRPDILCRVYEEKKKKCYIVSLPTGALGNVMAM